MRIERRDNWATTQGIQWAVYPVHRFFVIGALAVQSNVP